MEKGLTFSGNEGVAILEDSAFFTEKGNNINQSTGKKQIRVDCGKENEHGMLETSHG